MENAAKELREKDAEIERLRKELKESNANHELYERRWYLRENETERLREALELVVVYHEGFTLTIEEVVEAAHEALKEKE